MGRSYIGPSRHGFSIEGERWARDYYVECRCGWNESGISSYAEAEIAGGAHLYETRDDQDWVDED